MNDEAQYDEDPLYQAVNFENPTGIVPILSIKPEFIKVEDLPAESLDLESPSEILSSLPVNEELLDIKEEPHILHPMPVYGDVSDECNADYKNIKLRVGSDEDLSSLREEETVDNNTVLHNTASPDSQKHLPLIVTASPLPQIPSVHQYSSDTLKERMDKNGNTSTIPSPESKPYTCDICHKCFCHLRYLRTHMTIHTGSKPYTCETCHKCFRLLSDLKIHIRVHTGSKPYTCDTCHKSFSQLSSWRKHDRIHTGNKPYTCDTCHKSFNELSNLKTHIRIHTGNKPYTCDTCHKCFRLLTDLERHVRIHTGSKPYTCDTCYKSFNQLSNLKKHMNTHREQNSN